MCHSHEDKVLAEGLQVLLKESGWDIYVDWKDHDMPATPNRETAQRIQTKIKAFDFFLFLATPNSTSSKRCPWEIGYADSAKSLDKIFIIPTTESGKWYGSQYLQLYRQITDTNKGDLAAFAAGQTVGGILVKSL